MRHWAITGLTATTVMVLVLTWYAISQPYGGDSQWDAPKVAEYVGALSCADCHEKEYDEWRDSHHDRAMEIATEETVLGDFNDAIFRHHGIESRFFRDGERFMVRTLGPEGELADFEITHTFGWFPLQQYLVPFPGGRLQCLTIAWDDEEKEWYHLYPHEPQDPGDWLFWTNPGMNWNLMCAECHTTGYRKGYDAYADTYDTTYAEIDVSCEACHGPSSLHNEWAELPEPARPADTNMGLVVDTGTMDALQLVENCMFCHSRRATLTDYDPAFRHPMDIVVPTLYNEDVYYPDGQILDEVYVYGSFIQSKMYKNGVLCADCHNVHSLERLEEGNDLCLQCHVAEVYDSYEHHFHKYEGEEGEPVYFADGEIAFDVGTGALCVECHMPGRDYMGIDYRFDHSMRVPRPDMSIALGVPNACNRCHFDETTEWAADYFAQWYGASQEHHYGEILAAGRRREPEAQSGLVSIVEDVLYPPLVRATALTLLSTYSGPDVTKSLKAALVDEEAIVRQTALRVLPAMPPEELLDSVGPLLSDPVLTVRIEAAKNLTTIPAAELPERWRSAFDNALEEFQRAMEYSGDFAVSRMNLGALHAYRGEPELAEQAFRKAIEIDDEFYEARANLAVLLSQQGRNDLAEEQLRAILIDHPDQPDALYSLGLLLAEEERYGEAVELLTRAAALMPNQARVHYNLGQLLSFMRRDTEAERALKRAYSLDQGNAQYTVALVEHYLGRELYEQARGYAQVLGQIEPDNPDVAGLLEHIDTMLAAGE